MNPPRAVAMSFPFSARRLAASLLLTFLSITPLLAADVTWDNGFGNFLWDLSSPNWSGALWNNAPGNGAVFGATGAGAINVSAPINVDSLGFLANGYTLNGTGPITFVKGSSTLGTGNVFVDTGLTATINAPINSSLGLTKRGQGTLQLGGPITFSGLGRVVTPGTNILAVDIYAGGISGQTPSAYSGITRIMNTSVLPTTTRLGVSNGLFDFGALNQTLGSITFNNDQDSFAFNPATRTAGVGLTGTGTLRVTGDINVLGNVTATNNGANSIANNVDFGGGTQVFRVSSSSIQAQGGALQMTGILSNGSLLKTLGFNQNGVMVAADGIGLFGNNTYTGSTRISGGTNVVTGTNASTSVEVIGSSNGSVLSLQGANGSYLSATTIQAVSGATFQIDNNASLAGFNPITPGAQNNNRLSDTVQLQLRDGGFLYRGLANTAATETIGSLDVSGGHNVFNMATSGTGTVALTVANNFTMGPRSSLAFNIATLGGTTQLFVNGTTPAADATGILPRVVTTSDFVTYNGATGLTPYTGYATDFSTPGTNVSVTAASTVASSVNINALKRGTASFTTTLGAGVTLGVTSGMILSTGGTGTFTGGTIAFGSAPGAFFGTNTVSSAITGTSGLLNALGTLTLNGDLSGLTGTMTQNGFGTTALATNTFAGPIEVREGGFNINVSQTLAGQGAITLGVAANDVDMIGAPPLLSIAGAGANAIIARDIIVNNGSLTNAGVRLGAAFMSGLAPLSNTTGSQTVSGNISLLSPLRIQGGGAGGTGSTNFTGNITGSSSIRVVNGRMSFSGNYSNAGGFWLGEQGNVAQITFNGTAGGTAPLDLNGANAGSFIAYTSGALPTGTITTVNVDIPSVPMLTPLNNSTINNDFHLDGVGYSLNTNAIFAGSGSVGGNVGAGISATWAGQMSGLGGVVKAGTGTLTLSNANNTYTGPNAVNAGTLLVNGNNAASSTTVASTGTLGGNGNLSGPVTVNTGGTIAPGTSIGTLSTGSLSLSGTFLAEINLSGAGAADLLNLTGSFNITGGILMVAGLPTDATLMVNYAYSGTDSLGRIGNGNDLAVTVSSSSGGGTFLLVANDGADAINGTFSSVVPEPQTYALLGSAGAFFAVLAIRRKRASARSWLIAAKGVPVLTSTPLAIVVSAMLSRI